jgi:hypothetical protein
MNPDSPLKERSSLQAVMNNVAESSKGRGCASVQLSAAADGYEVLAAAK